MEKLFSGEFWEFVLNYEGNLNGGIGIWVFLRICSGFHVGALRRGDHLCVNLCIWRNFGAPLCCARGDINQGNWGGKLFYLRTTARDELFVLRTTARDELFVLRAGARDELFVLRAGARDELFVLRAGAWDEGLLSRSPNN
jgi:hypothetical protein